MPLGIILAGGGSRRYGVHKAFVSVGGERMVDRVRRVLEEAGLTVGIVANEPEPYRPLSVPVRRDAGLPLGPLSGIRTALQWAKESAAPGAVVIACDMPFVTPALVRRLLIGTEGVDAVVPESGGPRGVEPLCAYYATGCLPAVEAALAREDRSAVAFLPDVRVHAVPRGEVERFGSPELLFLNVNTPEDRARAEAMAAGGGADGVPAGVEAPRVEARRKR